MDANTSYQFTLLEKAKADEEALGFEQYRRRLAVLVHFKLSPQARERSEVDDVVQETCLWLPRRESFHLSLGSFCVEFPRSPIT